MMAPDLLGSLDLSQMQSLFNDSFNACVPECAGGLGSCFCFSSGASLIDIPPFLLSPGGGGTCRAMALLPPFQRPEGRGWQSWPRSGSGSTEQTPSPLPLLPSPTQPTRQLSLCSVSSNTEGHSRAGGAKVGHFAQCRAAAPGQKGMGGTRGLVMAEWVQAVCLPISEGSPSLLTPSVI